MKITSRSVALSALILASVSSAQVTMTPLTTFAGDGWLAPGEISWLSGTAATERSIAYSSQTNQLFVASRTVAPAPVAPFIRILDATTGAEINAGSNGVAMGGVVTGGTFPMSCVAVAADGVLYACNLASPVSPSPFKIYRWDDIGSAPAVVFESTAITTGRMGDTFDVIGSGTGTLLGAGESNSSGVGARNGYAIFSTTGGTTFNGTLVTFAGPPPPVPSAGDFRIGITFTDADSVLGLPGAGGVKFTSYNGAAGTLEMAQSLTTTSERPMDYIVLGGKPLLATIETNGNTATPPATFSTVRVYDLTNPTPVMAASGRTAASWLTQGASGPFTGSVQWGQVTGNSAALYALSTNNGIQAFTVTVPAADPPLAFTNINLTGGVLNLTWDSAPGRSYTLEAATGLTGWNTAVTNIGSGGATTSFAWTIPAGFTTRAQVRVIRQ